MTIEEFISKEEEILATQKNQFRQKVDAFNQFPVIIEAILKTIPKLQSKRSDNAMFLLQLFHSSHAFVRLPFMATLRGHYLENMALLRTAVEITSHIHRISKKPRHNAEAWLRRDEKSWSRQFQKIFNKALFGGSDAELQPLKKIYRECCDSASHATIHVLLGKGEFKMTADNITHWLFDFDANSTKTEGHLNYILNATQAMLRANRVAFTAVIDDDLWAPIDKTFADADSQMDEARRPMDIVGSSSG